MEAMQFLLHTFMVFTLLGSDCCTAGRAYYEAPYTPSSSSPPPPPSYSPSTEPGAAPFLHPPPLSSPFLQALPVPSPIPSPSPSPVAPPQPQPQPNSTIFLILGGLLLLSVVSSGILGAVHHRQIRGFTRGVFSRLMQARIRKQIIQALQGIDFEQPFGLETAVESIVTGLESMRLAEYEKLLIPKVFIRLIEEGGPSLLFTSSISSLYMHEEFNEGDDEDGNEGGDDENIEIQENTHRDENKINVYSRALCLCLEDLHLCPTGDPRRHFLVGKSFGRFFSEEVLPVAGLEYLKLSASHVQWQPIEFLRGFFESISYLPSEIETALKHFYEGDSISDMRLWDDFIQLVRPSFISGDVKEVLEKNLTVARQRIVMEEGGQ